MKKYLILVIFIFKNFFYVYSQPMGEWTWMNGYNTFNSLGVFGTQGISSPNNTPPAFYEPAQWTDKQGNFWLFGGSNPTGTGGDWCDLWKYNPLSNEWTWVKGPGKPGQIGKYGVQGIPSVNNNPGGRSWGAATWVDENGNLWLFGGMGQDRIGSFALFNDLWKYNISTNEWTWMKGPDTCGLKGIFGTKTISNPNNIPPPTAETSCTWIENDNLWLYCGAVYYYSNALWKYNINTNEWVWMNGDSITSLNIPPVYGKTGTYSQFNNPGGRYVYSSWKDKCNNFWLFSGVGFYVYYNDIWKYNPLINQWACIDSGGTENFGGTKCNMSSTNLPPGRLENRSCWTDDFGNLWTFGGAGPGGITYNDFWNYNIDKNQWTWISQNQNGVYGTKGVSSPSNVPPARAGAVSWKDYKGNLWLFGGNNFASGLFNDLWRYVPDTLCPSIANKVLKVKNSISYNCTSGTAKLIINGGILPYTYKWSNGATSDSITAPTGKYIVTVTDNACNTQIDTIEIKVNNLIISANANPFAICVGQSCILTASGANNYSWDNNLGAGDTKTVSPTNNTTYYVTGSDNNGCTDTSLIIITVLNTPSGQATVDKDKNFILEDFIFNWQGFPNNYKYEWDFGDGTTSDIINPQHNYKIPGKYQIKLKVTTEDSCSAEYILNVEVIIKPTKLDVPNIFSPNGDGKNDVFKVHYEGEFIEFKIKIFNRWGVKLYESQNINYTWDARTNTGYVIPDGTYYYIIYAKDKDGKEYDLHGAFNLIR